MPIEQTWSLEKVLKETRRVRLYAEPVSETLDSPWLALGKGMVKKLGKAIGCADYQAHEGLGLTPRGVFLAELLKEDKEHATLKNASSWSGAKMVIEKEVIKNVKKEVVYLIIFGREIKKWKTTGARNYFSIILYNSRTGKIFSEGFVKVNFSSAYAYFSEFEKILVKAANYKQYGKGQPFYFIHRMGKKIFSRFKVVWGEVGTKVNAAVVASTSSSGKDFLIPDYTCVYIPLNNEDEAHYVCAILNSCVSQMITSYIHLHPDPHVLENVRIEKYDKSNKLHKSISNLSRIAHRLAMQNNDAKLAVVERRIDIIVGKLYGFSSTEIRDLRKNLN